MTVGSDLDGLPVQKVLRDLVALSAVTSVWVGRESQDIATDLADLLVRLLNLDFAFVRLRNSDGSAAAEIARGTAPPTLLDSLQRYLDERSRLSHPEVVPGAGDSVQGGGGIVLPLGVNAEIGLVAAASDRPDFPSEIDQLLLSLAAGHGATAFKMARTVEEHRRTETALAASERQVRQAHDELEMKVAERTAELRRSETYLAEAERLSHTGTWAVNLKGEGTIVYASEESYRIYGLDPQQGVPKHDAVWQRVHPDDRTRLYEEIQEAERQKIDFLVEFRILLPDGTVKYVEEIGHHVFSERGELLERMGIDVDVTERKRAQEALRESEAKFRDYAESASDWLWEIGPDYKYTLLTENAFGSNAADRIGTACWDHALDLETEPEKWRIVWATLDSRKPFRDFVYCSVGGDGSPMYVKASGKPVFDTKGEFRGYRGTGTDVTATMRAQAEREQLTQQLKRREAYLAEAQRVSHTGSWSWSPTQDIKYWSEECYRVLSFDPQDGLPRLEDFLQRIHPDDQPGFSEITETAIREKAEWEADYRIVHPDGLVRDIHALGHPVLSASGHLMEFVGTVIDVTERKRAEQERARLRQLEADLAHINRVSTLGEMAASLAHEVKQPITAARNNAGAALNFLAKKPPNLGEVREALGCIVGDAERAGDIIDRIRAHTRKVPPRKDRFDLNEAITEVVELAQSAIAKHGICLEMRLAKELSAVQGDRVQLQQVILNLTLNAIEAMSSVDGPQDLSISTEQGETNSLVSVRDSGPGIDLEKRERVFEAFYTTKSNGVGIGLSICRSIIDAHGGRLWIEANEPRGATFRFTVPSAAGELRSSPQSLHQTREPYEHSVPDAAHQRVSAGNTRPPHLARGPRRRHRDRTS